jgi:hypothetical protein
MNLIDRLDRKFGRYAVTNSTVYLIAAQTMFYVLIMMGKLDRSQLWFSADSLFRGEWWRLVTFLFDPPLQNPFFAFFAWYLFYLMGSALEELWGAFRYNLFLLLGFLLMIAASFVTPAYPVSNAFIAGSVFLAFAHLFPDFQLLLFFVLPVRVKWLALLTWLGYGYLFLVGDWSTKMMVLASVGNFLLFFARDIMLSIRYGKRKMMKRAAATVPKSGQHFHRCTVCGITDKTHPDMDFRYCPDCTGQQCYCTEHIYQHDHIKK